MVDNTSLNKKEDESKNTCQNWITKVDNVSSNKRWSEKWKLMVGNNLSNKNKIKTILPLSILVHVFSV